MIEKYFIPIKVKSISLKSVSLIPSFCYSHSNCSLSIYDWKCYLRNSWRFFFPLAYLVTVYRSVVILKYFSRLHIVKKRAFLVFLKILHLNITETYFFSLLFQNYVFPFNLAILLLPFLSEPAPVPRKYSFWLTSSLSLHPHLRLRVLSEFSSS